MADEDNDDVPPFMSEERRAFALAQKRMREELQRSRNMVDEVSDTVARAARALAKARGEAWATPSKWPTLPRSSCVTPTAGSSQNDYERMSDQCT